jgi:hypothetical protein
MKQTILVATWERGPFAVTGDGRGQEIADLSVRGLAPDGHAGAPTNSFSPSTRKSD